MMLKMALIKRNLTEVSIDENRILKNLVEATLLAVVALPEAQESEQKNVGPVAEYVRIIRE
jgi:hypothetical protein